MGNVYAYHVEVDDDTEVKVDVKDEASGGYVLSCNGITMTIQKNVTPENIVAVMEAALSLSGAIPSDGDSLVEGENLILEN